MDTKRTPANPLFTLKRTAPPPPLSGSDHDAYMRLVQDAWRVALPALKRVVELDVRQWTGLLYCWLDPHDEGREEIGRELTSALEEIINALDPSYDEGWESTEEQPTVAIPALLCAIQMGFSANPRAKPSGAAPAPAPLELAAPPRPKVRPRGVHHRVLLGPEDGVSTSNGKYCLYTDEQLLKAYRMIQTKRYRHVDIARRLKMNASYISKISKNENARIKRLLAQQEEQERAAGEGAADTSEPSAAE